MRRETFSFIAATLLTAVLWQAIPTTAEAANGWEGRRRISYQQQKDLFYNYYAQPYPGGSAAQMYVSPQPVPAFVGHTYTTYQPLMPHEYLYRHQRSYYTYNRGAGWTRTNVRYGTCCLWGDQIMSRMFYPLSNGIWNVHNDELYTYPRF